MRNVIYTCLLLALSSPSFGGYVAEVRMLVSESVYDYGMVKDLSPKLDEFSVDQYLSIAKSEEFLAFLLNEGQLKGTG